jgi:hypothetical protein
MVQFGTIFIIRLDPHFGYVCLFSGKKICFDYDNATPVYIAVSATAIVVFFQLHLKFMCYNAEINFKSGTRKSFSSSRISPIYVMLVVCASPQRKFDFCPCDCLRITWCLLRHIFIMFTYTY